MPGKLKDYLETVKKIKRSTGFQSVYNDCEEIHSPAYNELNGRNMGSNERSEVINNCMKEIEKVLNDALKTDKITKKEYDEMYDEFEDSFD